MDLPETLKQIKENIIINNLEEVFKLLNSLVLSEDLRNMSILLNGNFNSWRKKFILNIVSSQDYEFEINKIRYSLLEFTKDILREYESEFKVGKSLKFINDIDEGIRSFAMQILKRNYYMSAFNANLDLLHSQSTMSFKAYLLIYDGGFTKIQDKIKTNFIEMLGESFYLYEKAIKTATELRFSFNTLVDLDIMEKISLDLEGEINRIESELVPGFTKINTEENDIEYYNNLITYIFKPLKAFCDIVTNLHGILRASSNAK